MQDNLVRNFPTFMNRLMDPPGLPDLHVAVISTDMGAGDGSIAGCDATGGKNGIFQYQPRADCTSTGLAPGATFIADDGTNRNYTGTSPTCSGASRRWANPAAASSTSSQRSRARWAPMAARRRRRTRGSCAPTRFLVILVLTNEDDCSAPAGSDFYDTMTNMTLASDLGPPLNFRCNEFGHLCNGVKPPRLAPNGDVTRTWRWTDASPPRAPAC